jgi:hypothetical protein
MNNNSCLLILLITSIILIGANLPVGLSYAQNNQSSSGGGGGNMYNLTVSGKSYPVKYNITGGKLNNMTVNTNKGALLVEISSQSNGNLTIELPRTVLDSKKPGGSDEQFVVLQDGQNSDFEEKSNNNQTRTLVTNFDKGTQEIEIDGTRVLPITSIPLPAKSPSTTITVQGNKTTVITGLSAQSKSTQSTSAGPGNTSAPSTSRSPSNSTYNLKVDSKKTVPIKYQISGNGNKLNSITAQKDNTTLLASISSQSDGKLIIELPRTVIDSKKIGNKDTDYAVFQDGQDAAADEIKNNNQVRTLATNFDKGTQEIEISGTQMVPEFGNITIITMIFAIAIVTLVVTGSKYNKGLSTFMHK